MYINRKHSCKLCKLHKLELVLIEVPRRIPKRNHLIVECIDRHRDNNIHDCDTIYLRPLFQKLSEELSKYIFLLDDFSIDLLKFNSCNSVCNF